MPFPPLIERNFQVPFQRLLNHLTGSFRALNMDAFRGLLRR